jgi:ATP-dependent Lhr-like helicase
MRRVLVESIEYPYLQPQAQERLKAARNLARSAQLEQDNILLLEGNTCCIFPWMGTVAYRTLERFLNFFVRYTLDIRSIGGVSPYFLTLKLGKSSLEQLRDEVKSFGKKDLTGYDLVSSEECPRLQKYDEYIPNNLLRQAYICDSLDVAELREIIKSWEMG